MASVLLTILLLFFLPSADVEAQKNPPNPNLISLGSSLSPSPSNQQQPTSWLSPSRLFAFGFYPEGNGFAVGIWLVGQQDNNNTRTVVWTANRDDPPLSSNSTVEFTRDGRLILRTELGGTERPVADIGEQPAASASMLDSGNFVLSDNNSVVIWQSFDSPTDTILGGQNLSSGHDLISSVSISDHSSGRFHLVMQSDGNLVAYPVNGSDSYWSSWTPSTQYDQLSLNHSGFLFLCQSGLSEYSHALVNSSSIGEDNSATIIFRATLDADGIFRLYSHRFESNKSSNVSIMWSGLQDRCQVRGFCGFNSYCSSNNGGGGDGGGGEASCYCYPGFVFVDPDKKVEGCHMNFDEDGCINNKDDLAMLYNISSLENLMWGDYPYSVLLMGKEDCGKSCVKDCNCGAALYFGEHCRKFKLPLRYGTINSNNTATAFFKISRGGGGTQEDHIHPNIASSREVVIKNKKHLISILAASLGSIACLCSAIAIFSFLVYRHRVERYRKLSDNANVGLFEEFTLRSFSYDELEKATDGFKEQLGRGSYGTVYKGTLSGVNKTVAVKRLENVSEEGENKFQSEITAIGRTYHRNLVRLLGFCVEGSRKLLVYEYMSNGSLADLLFKIDRHSIPSWRQRVKIALDVARGVLYLHEECEACIIHCGIKPRNILMDDSWTAKISDFGVAKLIVMPNQIETIDDGARETTRGYLAPEWQHNTLISVKADIFSFGVVLLEVICCRSNIEVNVSTADEIILSTWVYKCFVTGQLCELLVVEDDEEVDLKMLERMVKVGLWCIQDDPVLRPPMKIVIMMLEGTMDIPVPPPPSPSLLLDS